MVEKSLSFPRVQNSCFLTVCTGEPHTHQILYDYYYRYCYLHKIVQIKKLHYYKLEIQTNREGYKITFTDDCPCSASENKNHILTFRSREQPPKNGLVPHPTLTPGVNIFKLVLVHQIFSRKNPFHCDLELHNIGPWVLHSKPTKHAWELKTTFLFESIDIMISAFIYICGHPWCGQYNHWET